MKEHEKLGPKMMSEFVCIFVSGHLCLWKDVIRYFSMAPEAKYYEYGRTKREILSSLIGGSWWNGKNCINGHT